MGQIIKGNGKFTLGFGASGRRPKNDDLSPAERKLLERVADQLLQEHAETLKKLGDE